MRIKDSYIHMEQVLVGDLQDSLAEMRRLGEALAWLEPDEICLQLASSLERQKRLVAAVETEESTCEDSRDMASHLRAFRDAQRSLLLRIALRFGRVRRSACLS